MPAERELLFQISRVASLHLKFDRAIERIARILEQLGGRAVLIELPDSPSTVPDDIQTFLSSFEAKYRSFYSVALLDGGEEIGRAVVCFASEQFHGDLLRRVSRFVGEQLGMLLGREQRAEQRALLNEELNHLRYELSTRKASARAEGLLVQHHGLSPHAARFWLLQQSRKSRMTVKEVSDRLVDCHGDSRLLESLRTQQIA